MSRTFENPRMRFAGPGPTDDVPSAPGMMSELVGLKTSWFDTLSEQMFEPTVLLIWVTTPARVTSAGAMAELSLMKMMVLSGPPAKLIVSVFVLRFGTG